MATDPTGAVAPGPGSGRCRVIRAQETYEGKQALGFLAGVTAESAGATRICMHLVTIPPGERGKAHLHEQHETAMYVLTGSVVTWTGEGLVDRVVIEPGDFMFIPAGEPHLPINLSETEQCTVVLARTDPNEQQSVVLRPDLDEINQKIEIRFKRFDTDGNGVLTEDDYVGLAQRLVDALRRRRRLPKGQAVIDGYRGLWAAHARDMDTDQDGQITCEEFHLAIARNVVGRNGVEETVVPLMRAVLELCDEDGSATLDQAEFARLMGAFGVPRGRLGRDLRQDRPGRRRRHLLRRVHPRRARSSTPAPTRNRRATPCSAAMRQRSRSGETSERKCDPQDIRACEVNRTMGVLGGQVRFPK